MVRSAIALLLAAATLVVTRAEDPTCKKDAPSKDGGCGCKDLDKCTDAKAMLENLFDYGGYDCSNTLQQIVDGLPAGSEDAQAELKKVDPLIAESQVSDWCPEWCGTCVTPASATISFPNVTSAALWTNWTATDKTAAKKAFVEEYCRHMALPKNCPLTITAITGAGRRLLSTDYSWFGRRFLQTSNSLTVDITLEVDGSGPPPMASMVELQQRIAANNSQPMKDATFSEMGKEEQGVTVKRTIGEPGSLTGMIFLLVLVIILLCCVVPGVIICFCCKCCCFKKTKVAPEDEEGA